MTDSMGLTLTPGDPVAYRASEADDGVTATVLRVLPTGRCLIQLDGQSTPAPGVLGELAGQLDLLERMKHGQGDDLQGAFEVESSTLTFMGEMEWGDDDGAT
jgi:hypothetical protein